MRTRIIALALFFAFSLNLSAQGFDENYVVYSGDLNSDGRTDLYVKQKPKIVILHGGIATPIVISDPPDVTDFVLTQNVDQTFTINGNLTSAQLSTMSSWPETIIEVFTNDYNFDNAYDIILNGVREEIDPNNNQLFNQLVFASTNIRQGSPMYVLNMDDDVQNFLEDVVGWLNNPNYFEETAPPIPVITTHIDVITNSAAIANNSLLLCGPGCNFVVSNPLTWLPINAGLSCINLLSNWFINGLTTTNTLDSTISFFCNPTASLYIVYWEEIATVPDYTYFSDEALIFTDAYSTMLEDEKIITESVEAEAVEYSMEEILEVEVLQGGLSNPTIIMETENVLTIDEREDTRFMFFSWMIPGIKSDNTPTQDCVSDVWGPNPVTSILHFNRNVPQTESLNWLTLSNLPLNDFNKAPGTIFFGGHTGTHNIGVGSALNVDYRGKINTPYEGWQVIYDSFNNLVTDPANIGTFDLQRAGTDEHLQQDVTPWLEWGNTQNPNDGTTLDVRINALYSNWHHSVGWYIKLRMKNFYRCSEYAYDG